MPLDLEQVHRLAASPGSALRTAAPLPDGDAAGSARRRDRLGHELVRLVVPARLGLDLGRRAGSALGLGEVHHVGAQDVTLEVLDELGQELRRRRRP